MSKRQIKNRNLLSPVGFNFILTHSPEVDFYCNSANLPEISMGTAIQSTYLKNIDIPGDKIEYQDLVIQFLVDEEMENYLEIYNWMMSLGYPDSVRQTSNTRVRSYSDATLQILNSNFNPNGSINFKGLFPVSLSGLEFDATNADLEYFTAQAIFKYQIYTITDKKGNTY